PRRASAGTRSTPRRAEAWARARSPRSRRCSPVSQCSPAPFSAALRTPMYRVTASQTATDRLPKDSGSHSRGFALQSRGATGTTSCAPDPKREERGHDYARCDRHVAIPNARLRTHGKPSCDANLTRQGGDRIRLDADDLDAAMRQAFLGRRGPGLSFVGSGRRPVAYWLKAPPDRREIMICPRRVGDAGRFKRDVSRRL